MQDEEECQATRFRHTNIENSVLLLLFFFFSFFILLVIPVLCGTLPQWDDERCSVLTLPHISLRFAMSKASKSIVAKITIIVFGCSVNVCNSMRAESSGKE